MTLTISKVNNRFTIGQLLRKVATDKEYGLITNVRLTKISLLVWHIQFDVEIEE